MSGKLPFSVLLVLLFTISAFTQVRSGFPPESIFVPNRQPTVWLDRSAYENFQISGGSTKPFPLNNLMDPPLNYVNFDDMPWNGNAFPISPNRYPGVSFYAPYSNSGTFVLGNFDVSYSFPNHLLVGAANGCCVTTQSPLVIEFSQKMQDVALYLHQGGCQSAAIDIYENQAFSERIFVSVYPSGFTRIDFNGWSRKITKLGIYYNCALQQYQNPYIVIDDVYFRHNPYSSPVGTLETVSIQDGAAIGWSLDVDNQAVANVVHCYIDGGYAGATTANLPGSGVPYPGNHRFSFPIPFQYREGNQHTISCYGLDVTGGDDPTLLTGSPRTFKFNPPIGFQGNFLPEGVATGWSLDPDLPQQSNLVHFYIDGQVGAGGIFIGEALASIPRPDVNQVTGYPGNHGYEFPIPAQYRDGQNHTLYVYGIDLSGDHAKLLSASPKTFNLSPVVTSTTFVALPGSPVTANNNPGGGLRMFPESPNPGGAVNNVVNVRAKISANIAGIPVYFRAFDLDDPSANSLPLDDETIVNDNRSANSGDLCPGFPSGCDFDSTAQAHRVLTNSSGEAVLQFRLTEAHPGDNYAVIATTSQSRSSQIVVDGILLRNNSNNSVLLENIDRTPMLTAWRTLHIERDSMGQVTQNFVDNESTAEIVVGTSPVAVPVLSSLEHGRFNSGRLFFYNSEIFIHTNVVQSLSVSRSGGDVTIPPYYSVRLFDDDDFNSDNSTNGFDADNGEDVEALGDSFSLLQANDDRSCSDGSCNVLAAAYIQPEYGLLDTYNASNIGFDLNVASNVSEIQGQIALGRFSNPHENDNFWIAYVQTGYQGDVLEDCDPGKQDCTTGATTSIGSVNDVTGVSQVPIGSQGSMVYIESMRDGDLNPPLVDLRIRTVPHEIGHQFGIRGDVSEPGTDFGLMGYLAGRDFVERHLNILRWRRRSPVMP